MATEIRVPTLGESVTEATVGQWFKKVGDAVKADEPLVELETDKVTLEVPAPASGVLDEIAAKDGATVNVGALLATINAGRRRRQAVTSPTGELNEKTETTRPIGAGSEEIEARARPTSRPPTAKLVEEAMPRAAPDGTSPAAQKIMTETRHRARRRRRHRQGRPHHQGATCWPSRRPRRRRRRAGPRADRGARAVAARRCLARGARAHVAAPPDHRPPPQGGAEHRRDADDLQRGRHERGDEAARRLSRPLREEARRQARLHGLLREGVRAGAEGDSGGQCRDRRHRHRLQELLPHRHRRRHREGPGRAGGARRRHEVARRNREGDRRHGQARPRRRR